MKSKASLILACVCLTAGWTIAGLRAEEREASPEQLVEQLRSDDFDQRQAAAKKLETLGESARVALEKAAKDDDADLRGVALKLIGKLAKATLRVQVFDSAGAPAANAAGQFQIAEFEGIPGAEPRTEPLKLDAEGKAEFKLPSIGSIRYLIKLDGFIDQDSWETLDAHVGVNAVVATVTKGATVEGAVTDPDGGGVEGASVTLYSAVHFDPDDFEMQFLEYASTLNPNPNQAPNNAITVNLINATVGGGRAADVDPDGKWKLENVPEGVYTCVAQAHGCRPALGPMIRVHDGQPVTLPKMILKKEDAGKIELKLKKLDGTPRSTANVTVTLSVLSLEPRKAGPKGRKREILILYEPRATDENGAMTIGDLPAGKYALTVSAESDEKAESGVLIQTELDIKPGETVRPEQKGVTANGSIKGRVIGENGKGIKEIPVGLLTEDLVSGPEPINAIASAVTDSRGFYRFENVRPGKYAVFLDASGDFDLPPLGYVFGIEVEPGKKAVAPEAVLKHAGGGGKNVTIKGRILLADGAPAIQAQVQYRSTHQNITQNTGDDGAFSLSFKEEKPRADGGPLFAYLVITHAGCKPLAVQAPFENDRDYKLAAEQYGSLRVIVTDEKGSPLGGAAVKPIAGDNPFASTPLDTAAVETTARTNAKGVARLGGLAAGKREIAATLAGYYLQPHSGQIEIAGNDEKTLKLQLCPGVKIDGRVAIPAGASIAGTMVCLDDSRREAAGPDGAFSFDGVPPGEHVIFATSPTLVCKSALLFTLPNDPKKIDAAKPARAPIELVRPAGAAFDCGKEFAGCAVGLMPAEAFNLDAPPQTGLNTAGDTVDATGRAELWNVAPGRYQLVLSENAAPGTAAETRGTRASAMAGPFELQSVGGRAEVAKMPAIKVNLQRGKSSVTGRIRTPPRPGQGDPDGQVSIGVKIQSAEATAVANLNEPASVFWQDAKVPLIVGTAPEGFKPRRSASFEFVELRPGDYKIYATLGAFEMPDDEGAPQMRVTQSKLIGSFTIKDGEKVDLGELKFEPGEWPAAAKPEDLLKGLLVPVDKAPDFKP